jgi:hypothetical protein
MSVETTVLLIAALFFLLLASKQSASMLKKVAPMSEDVSLVVRTAAFILLFWGSLRLI